MPSCYFPQEYNIGDNVICIKLEENVSFTGYKLSTSLTLNKRYKILDIRTNYNKQDYYLIRDDSNNKQDYYLIRDDSNKLAYYNIDCFISIQKHRDKLINSIINDYDKKIPQQF